MIRILKQKEEGKMGKAWLRWVAGGIIVLSIIIYGFTFVLYEGNTAVITRFGAPRAVVQEAGFNWKLPWPFEKVYTFDSKKQCLDSSYMEVLTKDKKNVILQTYVVWSIKDPLKFLQSTGSFDTAKTHVDSLITNSKNGILGKYNLSALVSTNPEELKLNEIETAIFNDVKNSALERYGLEIKQIGFKKMGLPNANVVQVFDQMRAERLKYVAQLQAEGERDASLIRNEANVKVAEIKAEGKEKAAEIMGETEKEVAKIYAEAYKNNPGLYSFLKQMETLEKTMGDQSTIIFKTNEPPFNILKQDRGVNTR
jgi:modulator of FtsH protease HflC